MKICLDIDGVLADFVGGTARLMNFDPAVVTHWDYFPTINTTEEEFWRRIHACGEEFWFNLDPYPWMRRLFEECRDIAPTILLTSPSMCHTSAAGKVRWMKHHFGGHFRDYLIGSKKEFCANEETVLIDDSDINCEKFRAHNGIPVLFPQPWNEHRDQVDGVDRISYVVNELERIKEMLTA